MKPQFKNRFLPRGGMAGRISSTVRLLIAALLFTVCFTSRAALVSFALTNSTGLPDTNAIKAIPVNYPVLANGQVVTRGLPFPICPNTNGIVITNLQAGAFLLTNASLVADFGTPGNFGTSQGVLILVPNDTSTNVWPFQTLAASGLNTYNFTPPSAPGWSAAISNILAVADPAGASAAALTQARMDMATTNAATLVTVAANLNSASNSLQSQIVGGSVTGAQLANGTNAAIAQARLDISATNAATLATVASNLAGGTNAAIAQARSDIASTNAATLATVASNLGNVGTALTNLANTKVAMNGGTITNGAAFGTFSLGNNGVTWTISPTILGVSGATGGGNGTYITNSTAGNYTNCANPLLTISGSGSTVLLATNGITLYTATGFASTSWSGAGAPTESHYGWIENDNGKVVQGSVWNTNMLAQINAAVQAGTNAAIAQARSDIAATNAATLVTVASNLAGGTNAAIAQARSDIAATNATIGATLLGTSSNLFVNQQGGYENNPTFSGSIILGGIGGTTNMLATTNEVAVNGLAAGFPDCNGTYDILAAGSYTNTAGNGWDILFQNPTWYIRKWGVSAATNEYSCAALTNGATVSVVNGAATPAPTVAGGYYESMNGRRILGTINSTNLDSRLSAISATAGAITNKQTNVILSGTFTNNFGNSVAVSMTNAANQFVGNFNWNYGGAGYNFFAGGAGHTTISGGQNYGIGQYALSYITSGNYNDAVGYLALELLTTGSYNQGFGDNSLYNNVSGNGNSGFGDSSLENCTGSYNSGFGYLAGNSLTTGSSNIDIGNFGVAGDASITRIGDFQTDAYIAGIIHGNGGGLTNIQSALFNATTTLPQALTNLITALNTNGTVWSVGYQALSSSTLYTWAHGLNHTPYSYAVDFFCTNQDVLTGYGTNNVLKMGDIIKAGAACQQWCDATNVYLSVNFPFTLYPGYYSVVPHYGGNAQNFSAMANWKLRFEAQ
jgi:hypothetical protein